MSSSQTPERFVSLFVELTGYSTIEEHQHESVDHHALDSDEELTPYIAETTRQTGLDDAIDAPEDY